MLTVNHLGFNGPVVITVLLMFVGPNELVTFRSKVDIFVPHAVPVNLKNCVSTTWASTTPSSLRCEHCFCSWRVDHLSYLPPFPLIPGTFLPNGTNFVQTAPTLNHHPRYPTPPPLKTLKPHCVKPLRSPLPLSQALYLHILSYTLKSNLDTLQTPKPQNHEL